MQVMEQHVTSKILFGINDENANHGTIILQVEFCLEQMTKLNKMETDVKEEYCI